MLYSVSELEDLESYIALNMGAHTHYNNEGIEVICLGFSSFLSHPLTFLFCQEPEKS